MRWFPFYYIQYLPASLLLGMNRDEAASGLLVIFCWTLGALLLGEWAWRVLRKQDEGAGA